MHYSFKARLEQRYDGKGKSQVRMRLGRILKPTIVLCLLVASFGVVFMQKQTGSVASSGAVVLASIPLPSGAPDTINSVSVDSNTKFTYIAAGSSTDTPGAVYAFDNSNNSFANTIYAASGGSGDIDSNSGMFYFANQGSGNVTVIDVSDNEIVGAINVEGSPSSVAADSPDGLVFVGTSLNSSDSAIAVINESTQSVVNYVPLAGSVGNLLYDSSNGVVYSSVNSSSTVEISALNQSIVGTIPNFIPSALDGPKGVLYGVNTESGNFSAVRTTGSPLSVISLGPVGAIGFNSNTKRVYVSQASGDLAVLDASANDLIENVTGVGFLQAIGVDSATNTIYGADETSWTLSVIYDPPTLSTTTTSTTTVLTNTTVVSTTTSVQTSTSTTTQQITTTSTTTATSTATKTSTSTAKTVTTSTSLTTESTTSTVATTTTKSITATQSLTTTAVQTSTSLVTMIQTVSVNSSSISSTTAISSVNQPSQSSTRQTPADAVGPELVNLDLASVTAGVVAAAGGIVFLLRRKL